MVPPRMITKGQCWYNAKIILQILQHIDIMQTKLMPLNYLTMYILDSRWPFLLWNGTSSLWYQLQLKKALAMEQYQLLPTFPQAYSTALVQTEILFVSLSLHTPIVCIHKMTQLVFSFIIVLLRVWSNNVCRFHLTTARCLLFFYTDTQRHDI